MLDNEEDYNKCPNCGGATGNEPECPTYPRAGTDSMMMRCFPPCGNAWFYYCLSETCDWGYTDGLNPQNPRYDSNLRNKPSWIREHKNVA